MTVVVWFRCDLRRSDHGALAAAAGRPVVPLFVLDPALQRSAAGPRLERLQASLAALDTQIRDHGGPGLVLRTGAPAEVVAGVAAELDAAEVLVSADYSPYGLRRDRAVGQELAAAGRRLQAADSPYLHAPGTVAKADGQPYSVFTPYYRAWHALSEPAPLTPPELSFRGAPSDALPSTGYPAGEAAASRRLAEFAAQAAHHYSRRRDRTDLDGTSRLSAALHFGEVHPRTILAHLGRDSGSEAFIRQLCWREFYADVLFHRPEVAWQNVDPRFDRLPWRWDAEAQQVFEAWAQGRTGYPFVDAGMRQLLTEGWMHNRARLVAASFLTKDLMIDWRRGAAWFLRHLVDGDVANNNLGWQWVAGTGLDPSPYHRVFNPVLQGHKFDPAGDYVRRYVPELRALPGAAAHEPWQQPDAAPDYPPRVVDHAEARREALAAYDSIRG